MICRWGQGSSWDARAKARFRSPAALDAATWASGPLSALCLSAPRAAAALRAWAGRAGAAGAGFPSQGVIHTGQRPPKGGVSSPGSSILKTRG